MLIPGIESQRLRQAEASFSHLNHTKFEKTFQYISEKYFIYTMSPPQPKHFKR